MTRLLALVACLPLLALGTATAAADRAPTAAPLLAAPPPPGMYDAQLCVVVGAGPGNCGPVVVDLDDRNSLLVRIEDVVYRLQVVGDRLGVSLFHGTMQIDGFFASYQWAGSKLAFSDPEKGARYELRLGTRRFAAP